MRPRTQKQPQVKKELCRALDDVDVDVDVEMIFKTQAILCLENDAYFFFVFFVLLFSLSYIGNWKNIVTSCRIELSLLNNERLVRMQSMMIDSVMLEC